MARDLSDEEWAAWHHALARELFRTQLANALQLQTDLAGQPGFLSLDDIRRELVAALMVVSAIERQGGRT